MPTIEMRTLPENACIRRVPIFDKLTEEEMSAMQSVIQARRFGKGEYIFREGERSEAFYIVHSGVVKIAKCSYAGKEQVIRFLFAGDFCGQFSLLQQKSHYAFAEVLEDASVCLIRHADFRALLEQNAAMTYRFLLAVSERLAEADEWMSAISLTDAEERLAKMLLLFYNKGEPGDAL